MKIEKRVINVSGFSNSRYRLLLEQIELAADYELFRVSGNNGFLIYKSNRPLIRRDQPNVFKPHIKLVEGKTSDHGLELSIAEAIWTAIWIVEKHTVWGVAEK